MTVGPAACDLRGISRRFGGRWALRGVSMRVESEEVIGILGHNGSGKSTLLRIISTALRPTLGSGTVYGADLAKEAPTVRESIGFLAHAAGNYDDLSAAENLRFAAAMGGYDPSTIDAILERVGLTHVAGERARGFSAGMSRRLALGRLLLARPRLLLLDEPYNNFDAAGITLVNEVITETCQRGGAAIVVVHDRRQAEHLIDRDVVLARGAIVQQVLEESEPDDVDEVEARSA